LQFDLNTVKIVGEMARKKREKREKREEPYHHGDLRQALLDAAIDLLLNPGLAPLTLRAVARRAGVMGRWADGGQELL
jgi:DNA-binding transcriptional regulator YbjK